MQSFFYKCEEKANIQSHSDMFPLYKRLTLRSDLLAAAPNFVPKPRPDPLAEDLNIFSGVLQLDFLMSYVTTDCLQNSLPAFIFLLSNVSDTSFILFSYSENNDFTNIHFDFEWKIFH